MWARVIEADMDPSRVDVAARAVRYDVVPDFHRDGLWMANRTSGEVLVVTIGLDRGSLDASRSADGAIPANVIDRTGMRARAVHTMEVLASAEPDLTGTPRRSARATWTEGEGREVPRGSGGGYRLRDATTGIGLVLDLGDGPFAPPGRCTRVVDYELLGVAVP